MTDKITCSVRLKADSKERGMKAAKGKGINFSALLQLALDKEIAKFEREQTKRPQPYTNIG